MIDKIEQYMDGDCWWLALKISELTGWPAVERPEPYGQHVLVRVPDGRLLDWMGLHEPYEYDDEYGLVPFDPDRELEGFKGTWTEVGYTFPETEFMVDSDARTLLKREGLEWQENPSRS